jgi:hypothetical protein
MISVAPSTDFGATDFFPVPPEIFHGGTEIFPGATNFCPEPPKTNDGHQFFTLRAESAPRR